MRLPVSLSQLRLAAYALAVAMIFGAGWWANGLRLNAQISAIQRDAAQASQQAEAKARAIEQLSASLSSALADKYAAQKAAQAAQATVITKEVVRYEQAPYAGHCQLPNRWVRVDTAAATGVPPDSAAPSGPDDANSGATDSDVLALTVRRSTLYREQSAKLTALQQYVREQLELCGG